MGASCGKGSRVSEDALSGMDKPKKFAPPDPITCISGVDVDRASPLYQYALFCVTRLMDRYKDFMFPHVTMSLGSFREDLQDYLDVIEEIYNNLCFEERLLANGKVCFEADSHAKDAVSQLSFLFWTISEMSTSKKSVDGQVREDGDGEDRGSQLGTADAASVTEKDHVEKRPGSGLASRKSSVIDVAKLEMRYEEQKDSLQDIEAYKYSYEDTLKMLITDLERKEIWQLSTLYSNAEFQDYLKVKEPDTYRELNDDSVTIEVPKLLQRNEIKQGSSDDDG